MRFLFVTTENLAVNPRIYKELCLACTLGHQCDCVLAHFPAHHWSNRISETLEANLPNVHFIHFETGRNNVFRWMKYTVENLLYKFLSFVLPQKVHIAAFASSKRSIQIAVSLPREAKYDLVICHVIGALYPAWDYARKKHIPFACDIEDYHPGECLYEPKDHHEIKRRELIMKTVLSNCFYATFASPLIQDACVKLLGLEVPTSNWSVILNSFDEHEFRQPKGYVVSDKLQVVWFSQNISANRGLEILLPAFYELKELVNLTLIGNLDYNFYKSHLKVMEAVITIKPAIPQKLLHQEISQYDCGLACEVMTDANRGKCLTNKILAYCQAGLYVLASDTPAQSEFLTTHPSCGAVYTLCSEHFKECLMRTYKARSTIRKNAKKRWETAKCLSWQNQQIILERQWDRSLSKSETL